MAVPNDPSIGDDLRLFRRVTEAWIVRDENRGCQRLSSAAFDNYEMSVVLEDALAVDGRHPTDVLQGFPSTFLASITAGSAREQCQGVVRSPTQEEPAHGEVVGKKTKGRRRALVRAATWIVPPPTPCDG
jgi:hypothetical protein